MARLPYLEIDQLAAGDRDVLSRPINLYRVFAHNPEAARSFRTLGQYIRRKSVLDARLRELVILQVGLLARSHYEYYHHVKIAQEFGATPEDIAAVTRDTLGEATHLEPLVRTALAAAREMTITGRLTDSTHGALAAALSNAQLLDCLLTISFYNCVVRLVESLKLDLEDGEYDEYVRAFPLLSAESLLTIRENCK
jgi:4-carboxymuconolactone decarboxylase